ncbi:macrophage mannose receptor 1-like isoform X2 [Amphiura filiformis]|uniref:macrophage mannose receptor 1-like isoform X2 n=1 Tax=Amphiura filiformis TaxID=82378 RepID=UPI003B20CD0F
MLPVIFTLISFGYIMNMNSVVCQVEYDGDVRLVDGKEWEGRIEVYYDGGWRVVCYDTDSESDSKWSDRAAWVTCQQLGYPGGTATSVTAYSITGSRKFSDVRCQNGDYSLPDCKYEFEETDCRDDKQAGVICYNGEGACDVDSYIPFQNSCYKLSNERLNRPEAMSACTSDGGHLADITSLEEQEFIVSILKASGGGDAWFGLLQYKFIWSDRSPLIPKTWHDIYTNEDAICMYLRKESGYDWHDRLCDDYRYKYKSVCEFQAEGKCPNAFQNSCYKVLDESLTRTEAHRACTSDDGHLADITSSEEQEFIVSILKASGGGDAWFGLLKDPDAKFAWSDGSPLKHNETWQDIDTNENTVCMRLRENSGWHDRKCDREFKFVCEIEETPTHSTSAGEGGGKTAATAGSVVGVLLFVILTLVIALFIYKRSKNQATESGKARSENNNSTHELDSNVDNGNDAQPDNDYNYVGDAQPDNEYNYVDANNLRSTGDPVPDSNNDDNTYSYAETPVGVGLRPSAPEEQPKEEGWMENTIYSASDDVGDPNAQEEGWADNTVYGD